MTKKKITRVNRLNNISHRYVEDHELLDVPARLYRRLLNKLSMNPLKWGNYLRDYLEWVVVSKDPDKAKVERTTRQGNIKDTYFQKNTLSFNKLLEGLSIVRMRECEIFLKCIDEDGNEYIVSEKIKILGKERLNNNFKDETEEDDTTIKVTTFN